MSIQFKQKVTFYDKNGMLITTLSLVTRQELDSQFKQIGSRFESNSEPISAILRRGETHITIPNRFSSEFLTVSLEELLQDYKDQDLERLFLLIQNRFQPDAGETPLYPSDMVHHYRQLGMPEAQIQELLLKEKRTKDI